METAPLCIGVDVAKAQLDVATGADGEVVLEATGGFEVPVVSALAAAGIPVVVANPRQVRNFARALMKRTTKYVALDVRQATTVMAVREQSGRVIARGILPTEAPALVEFFSGMRGSLHVAFEECTQAQWLHDLLYPVVDRVIVCGRRGEPRGRKADQLDADQLSQRLLTGSLRSVYHGSADRMTLRSSRAHTSALSRTPPGRCCDSNLSFVPAESELWALASTEPKAATVAHASVRSRSPVPRRVALSRTGCAARAAARSQGRHDQ